MHPGHAQIGDIAGVDLGERTIMIGLVGAMIGQPVVLAAGFDARGIHRLRKGWRRGKRRTNGNNGRYSNGYSKITRLFLHRSSSGLFFYALLTFCLAPAPGNLSKRPLLPMADHSEFL